MITQTDVFHSNLSLFEKEAVAANEQAAAIMKATAWREFKPDQLSKMKALLAAHPGKVTIGWTINDIEALALAARFSKIFDDIPKWDMGISAKGFATAVVWGIRIPDVPGADNTVNLLREALTEAKVPFTTLALPPEQGMSFTGPDTASRAIIFFGTKQPTFGLPPF